MPTRDAQVAASRTQAPHLTAASMGAAAASAGSGLRRSMRMVVGSSVPATASSLAAPASAAQQASCAGAPRSLADSTCAGGRVRTIHGVCKIDISRGSLRSAHTGSRLGAGAVPTL